MKSPMERFTERIFLVVALSSLSVLALITVFIFVEGVPIIAKVGFFRFVSCPNYLGEIVEWTGWAIISWSLPGLAFAVWTAANLLPRALTHHRWYRQNFPDYPRDRKAILPLLL